MTYTERHAADVGANIGPEGATIKLPRLSVIVEVAQARRLRDKLNAVLPERIDPLHDPRVTDLDTVKAAMSIAHDAGYLSTAARIETVVDALERNVQGSEQSPVRVHECPRCEGDGRIALVTRPGDFETCATCDGTGKQNGLDCVACRGSCEIAVYRPCPARQSGDIADCL